MEEITSPRRAPAGAKAEQRIRDILRISREVFAESGYEKATTTEIAQRLGVSEATVFTYFHSKRELCVRVIEDWYDEIIDTFEQGMPHNQGTKAQLEFYVKTHLQLFLIQGTGLCSLVLSEGRAKGPDFGEVFVPLQRRYTAPLMDLLARGRRNGEIRDDLPLSLLRSAILGPMEHILWDAVAREREVDIDKTASDMVALLWPALLPANIGMEKLRAFYGEVGAALKRAEGS